MKNKKSKKVIGITIFTCLVALILATRFTDAGNISNSTAQTSNTQSSTHKTSDVKIDTDSTDKTCKHDWTITYKTVHHDAVTHTENIEPVYREETSYHTVCNECQQIIDGNADQHIKDTGHSGYSTNVPITNEVLVSEGYSHEVVDKPAYDETIPDVVICTICGETRSTTDIPTVS